MESKTRVQILFLASALVLSYARLILGAGEYWWDSASVFVFSWLGNYVAMILVTAFSYAVLKANESRFLGEDVNTKKLSMDQVFYVTAVIVAVGSVLTILAAHYMPSNHEYSVW